MFLLHRKSQMHLPGGVLFLILLIQNKDTKFLRNKFISLFLAFFECVKSCLLTRADWMEQSVEWEEILWISKFGKVRKGMVVSVLKYAYCFGIYLEWLRKLRITEPGSSRYEAGIPNDRRLNRNTLCSFDWFCKQQSWFHVISSGNC